MTISSTTPSAAKQRPQMDPDYLKAALLSLLEIPSPTGYTDQIVHWLGEELERLKIPFELTRRGAIRADLKGKRQSPTRAVVTHLDSVGAMVTRLKPNGRLAVAPIGTWSSRFAEGARVTVFCDEGCVRGTILPLLASGHTFHDEIDTQPVSWDNLEVRLDELVQNEADLARLGMNVGDYVAIDPQPEVDANGFVNARHLDDKAGVAVVLMAARAIAQSGTTLPVDSHLVFTISEEVGSGSSHTLHGNVAEMVTVDNATAAPGQNSDEFGVTIAMMDSSGPFDYHLTHKLIDLCGESGIPLRRDVFRYYRSDSASAVDAGNDLRTALVCFGVDASHGYERTHVNALMALAELVAAYLTSPPTFLRDRDELAPLKGFPTQPTEPLS